MKLTTTLANAILVLNNCLTELKSLNLNQFSIEFLLAEIQTALKKQEIVTAKKAVDCFDEHSCDSDELIESVSEFRISMKQLEHLEATIDRYAPLLSNLQDFDKVFSDFESDFNEGKQIISMSAAEVAALTVKKQHKRSSRLKAVGLSAPEKGVEVEKLEYLALQDVEFIRQKICGDKCALFEGLNSFLERIEQHLNSFAALRA